jgi:hypothetical protein
MGGGFVTNAYTDRLRAGSYSAMSEVRLNGGSSLPHARDAAFDVDDVCRLKQSEELRTVVRYRSRVPSLGCVYLAE